MTQNVPALLFWFFLFQNPKRRRATCFWVEIEALLKTFKIGKIFSNFSVICSPIKIESNVSLNIFRLNHIFESIFIITLFKEWATPHIFILSIISNDKTFWKVFFPFSCHLEVYYRIFYIIWFLFMITKKQTRRNEWN